MISFEGTHLMICCFHFCLFVYICIVEALFQSNFQFSVPNNPKPKLTMPQLNKEEIAQMLDDDSSDEEDSNENSDDESSENDSGSDNDSGSGSDSDDDDDVESGSGSDNSDDESGSDSDSDDSSSVTQLSILSKCHHITT